MVTNGGFLVTKIKQLGDRIFEKVLAEKGVDAFNGAQGRILYVLWQQDGVPIKTHHIPDHNAGAHGTPGPAPQRA